MEVKQFKTNKTNNNNNNIDCWDNMLTFLLPQMAGVTMKHNDIFSTHPNNINNNSVNMINQSFNYQLPSQFPMYELYLYHNSLVTTFPNFDKNKVLSHYFFYA